jgi:DNA-binding NarL/FixJ family response regulator
MITLHGVYKDGQVTLLEHVPFSEECHVLITFLDELDKYLVVPKGSTEDMVSFIEKNLHNITNKELEILRLVQKGMTNAEIADVLELGDGTIRNYLSSIYTKLEVANRTEAIFKAIELEII